MSDHPLIYVDLIKERPMPREAYDRKYRGSTDPDNAYRAYRIGFQPWRILVKSGGNHEPLFRSTERYLNEDDARHAAEIAFGGESNVWLRQEGHGNKALRLAAQ